MLLRVYFCLFVLFESKTENNAHYLHLFGELVCNLEVTKLQSQFKLMLWVASYGHRLRTKTLHTQNTPFPFSASVLFSAPRMITQWHEKTAANNRANCADINVATLRLQRHCTIL